MILDYVQRQYVPSNIVISVAGNVEPNEVEAMVEERFGHLKAGSAGAWFTAQEEQNALRSALLFKRTEQSHVALGLRGYSLSHPDRYALDLLSVLFGEGMSSRLFLELREAQGLCYDVHSYVTHFLDTGSFNLYAAVDPKNARRTVEALITELKKLRLGVLPEELHKARELAKGRMLLRMEDTRSVSGWLGGQEVLRGEILSPEDIVERLEEVTTDDLRRVAEDLLKPEQLSMAIVGPHRSERVFQSRVSF
jgi:predicted Zn-dependent peptidase